MMSLKHKRARIDTTDTVGHNNGSNGSLSVVDHKDKLLLHIHELYLRKDYSDVKFEFGPDVIYGHKLVLSINSKWRHLIHDESTVDMEDTPLTAFKELLRYLYTGRLDLESYEPEMLAEIRQLAERFDMRDLSRPIQDMEDIKVNADNCVQLYADAAIDSQTGQSCLAYIAHNLQELLYLDEFFDLDVDHMFAIFSRHDLNVNEQTVFEAVKKYITGDGKGDKRRLLSAVRFSLLPFEYIWTTVRKFCDESRLMSVEELSAISAAKAKLTEHKPDIRERAHCLSDGVDVVALRAKQPLSTRVLKGKVGDTGDEANAVELDLGLLYLINGLGLMLSSASKVRYAFKLETSVDRKDWQLLYDFTKYHTSNKLDLNFDPQVVRYIRLSNAISYPDWAEKRKESKPVRKIQNIVAVYEEPQGIVRRRDHLLASKYLYKDLACDFTYKSWHKKDNKYFYVCALNDPIVCILSQPVWMEAISLYLPEDEVDREYNFTVEVTSEPLVEFKANGGRGDKTASKGWLMVGDFRDESRRGDVEVTFEATIVNAFRVTGTRIVNPKGKEKDFAVEIRL